MLHSRHIARGFNVVEVLIVFAGTLVFVTLLAVGMVALYLSANRKRLVECTLKTTAKVIDRTTKWYRYANPGNRHQTVWTLEYLYNGATYTRQTGEVPSRPEIGDIVTIYLNPNAPQYFYVDGAVENINAGAKRVALVFGGIIAYFLIILLWALMSA